MSIAEIAVAAWPAVVISALTYATVRLQYGARPAGAAKTAAHAGTAVVLCCGAVLIARWWFRPTTPGLHVSSMLAAAALGGVWANSLARVIAQKRSTVTSKRD